MKNNKRMSVKKILDRKKQLFEYMQGLGFDTRQIKDENLLLQAFIHKSFAADFKIIGDHNERLEFLGDSVLGAAICKFLFLDHPEMAESEMTLYKIALVREETLAYVARKINLGSQILISRGEEKTQGRKKDAILSDTLEAIIGYISIDLGYYQAEKFIKDYIYSMYDHIDKNPVQSYKTMVQEIVQKKYKQIPEYIDIEHNIDEKGNVLIYKSELFILGKKSAEGFGQNKKKAQEDAAQSFYNSINVYIQPTK